MILQNLQNAEYPISAKNKFKSEYRKCDINWCKGKCAVSYNFLEKRRKVLLGMEIHPTKMQVLEAYCPPSILPLKRRFSQSDKCPFNSIFRIHHVKMLSNLHISVK